MRLSYDDSALMRAMEELPVKRQQSALKGGMRRLGNRFKKKIVAEAKGDGIQMSGPLKLRSRSVRVLVGRRIVGFAVTIAPKRKAGGIKPVLPWLSLGTADRRQGYRNGRGGQVRRGVAGHSRFTGRLRPRDFFRRATVDFEAETNREMQAEIFNSCQAVFRKYCK